MSKKWKVKLQKYPRCNVTNKKMYPTEDHARAAMFATWRNTSMSIEEFGKDFHSYKCDHCGKFHNGHMSKYIQYVEKKEAQ